MISRASSNKQYIKYCHIIIAVWVLAFALNMAIVTILFRYTNNFGLFAIPSVPCTILALLAFIAHAYIKPPTNFRKNEEAPMVTYLLMEKINYFVLYCPILFGALISTLAMIFVILEYKGVLKLQNWNAFIIFISLPLWPSLVCLLISSINATANYILKPKKPISVPCLHYHLSKILLAIFSTAIITATYIIHGNTNSEMIILPIIAAFIMQSCFFSGMLIPKSIERTTAVPTTYEIISRTVSTALLMGITQSIIIVALHFSKIFPEEAAFNIKEVAWLIFVPLISSVLINMAQALLMCCAYKKSNDGLSEDSQVSCSTFSGIQKPELSNNQKQEPSPTLP